MENAVIPLELHTISERYRVIRKIGGGSFGEIFIAVDLQTRVEVAVKVEKVDVRHPQLIYESRVYRYFREGIGFPHVHYVTRTPSFTIMILDLLGPSLEDLFNFCNRKFSLKTVLMITLQLLDRIEYIHNKDFVHRDIKPENLLMGNGYNRNILYVVDYGLSKRFRDKNTPHIAYRADKNLIGTARYASINSHKGKEQSRRDDMESLAYVILYFLRGSLPWQNQQCTNKRQKYEKICEKKITTPLNELCQGFPLEFQEFITSVRSLNFDVEPAYYNYRIYFTKLFNRLNYKLDYNFDWSKGCGNPQGFQYNA